MVYFKLPVLPGAGILQRLCGLGNGTTVKQTWQFLSRDFSVLLCFSVLVMVWPPNVMPSYEGDA